MNVTWLLARWSLTDLRAAEIRWLAILRAGWRAQDEIALTRIRIELTRRAIRHEGLRGLA